MAVRCVSVPHLIPLSETIERARVGGFPFQAISHIRFPLGNFPKCWECSLNWKRRSEGSVSSGNRRMESRISSKASVLLQSEEPVHKVNLAEIVPAVIVGGGRVGQALEKMGLGRDMVVRRGQGFPVERIGPIIVCTRNSDLDEVINAIPSTRREDLVFIQNGMLELWLESRGLSDATKILVYFAVAKAGDPPIDGKTDLNPEGLTVATGKWASAIAYRLHSAGLSSKVLDAQEFKKPQLEKLIWICSFMLVGARHGGVLVGDVENVHHEEVVNLINELGVVASTVKGVTFDAGLAERLCAYARSVAHFATAVKEFEWRNGWFYQISKKAISQGEPDPCPLHTSWLKEVGAVKE